MYMHDIDDIQIPIKGHKQQAHPLLLNGILTRPEQENAKEKRLVIVPGAGYLFEEPGTLEEAAKHAAS
jgi:hypothetical protein